jgi:hypothetical protein
MLQQERIEGPPFSLFSQSAPAISLNEYFAETAF